jgi:hypothetical protein
MLQFPIGVHMILQDFCDFSENIYLLQALRRSSLRLGCSILDCRGKINQHCHSENCGAEMHAELELGLRNGAALIMWMQSLPAIARVHEE